MSTEYYYQLFKQAKGEVVELETADGSKVQAIIENVDLNYVYLRKLTDLAQLFMKADNDTEEYLQKTLLAIPLASIMSLTFIPMMYY